MKPPRKTAAFCSLLFAAAALACGPAAAGEACVFTAHLWDPDPVGTNVRSGPGTGSPVLTRLPQEVGEGDAAFSPEFEVTGFDRGWFEIRNVTVDQYGPNPERVIFDGPGWVSAKLVSFMVNDPRLLDAPDENGKVLAELVADAWGPQDVVILETHGCRGPYAEVTLETPEGKRLRGWVTSLCGNQVTTCS